MGTSSQKENNEARWWVSLLCVCQVLRSQHRERKARAVAPNTAAAMAPKVADRLLPGVHLGCPARGATHNRPAVSALRTPGFRPRSAGSCLGPPRRSSAPHVLAVRGHAPSSVRGLLLFSLCLVRRSLPRSLHVPASHSRI